MSSHAQTHEEPHVDSMKTYFLVYGALLVLTVLTVLVSTTFNIGHISHGLSLGVAMFIAATKGTLVVLFFMHVLHESKLVPLILVVSLSFLFLFFSLTMVDVATRGVGDYVAGSQSFRELNNITVINEVPDHGAEGAQHDAEGAQHDAEGAQHDAEGAEPAAAADSASEGTEVVEEPPAAEPAH